MYLFSPKQKLLAKENPKVPQCQPKEKIKINIEFKHPNIKCSFIPTQTHKRSAKKDEKEQEEDKQNEKEIKLERQNIIDAVVVRIMKARKEEKHIDLL